MNRCAHLLQYKNVMGPTVALALNDSSLFKKGLVVGILLAAVSTMNGSCHFLLLDERN